MVATASASNATKVTASTRPTVSVRYAGVHIPPAGLVAAVEVVSASALIGVSVESQPRLRSRAHGWNTRPLRPLAARDRVSVPAGGRAGGRGLEFRVGAGGRVGEPAAEQRGRDPPRVEDVVAGGPLSGVDPRHEGGE